MQNYTKFKEIDIIPRLPLRGNLDITYRCNNNCLHCWLRVPPGSPEKQNELSTDEIKTIVDEARKLGCREWVISGGEPMLRPDFPEIFDYITKKSSSYSINTNGTLITPEIAELMKRKGRKMVALYGATAEVHDHVTRNPGSFQATMKGFKLLQEAEADFIVQLVPMKDNYQQYKEMVNLAKSLSPHWRVGAAWLFLSAEGDPRKNEEIKLQRLDPREVVELDKPQISDEEIEQEDHSCPSAEDQLFASCIDHRRDFHIDPYGHMSFCSFIKDPSLLYDLRKGSFQECWETFIPSLKDRVKSNQEYRDNCGSCDLKNECRWCPVYGYLEHRRFSAPVEYLCDVAEEAYRFKENWIADHCRYYGIGGITICVESDVPMNDDTFHENLELFRVNGPGNDNVYIRHHFSIPQIDLNSLGKQVYRRPPWAIYKKGRSWVYLGISSREDDPSLHKVAVFNEAHTRGEIYNERNDILIRGGATSLTMFPTDQILLAPLLSDRQGLIIHSAGMVINGHGLLFVGHSGAGKSTTVTMLQDEGEILCDDRNIVRRWPDGFRIHGTWSHGTVTIVSPGSAPLRAVLFIEQSPENRLIPVKDPGEIARTLPLYVIKSIDTQGWWNSTLSLIEMILKEVPVYRLQLDNSGKVREIIKELLSTTALENDGKAMEKY